MATQPLSRWIIYNDVMNTIRLSLSSGPRTMLTLILVAALLAPLAAPRPAVAQAPIRFDPADCMFTLPLGAQADDRVQCGYLTVPANYQDESQGSIRLAVAIFKSTGQSPTPDPLVMAQGGPGGSTIETYAQHMGDSPLRADRDIVLFDQRGTLYSQPNLYCTEIDDLTVQTIEQDLTPEENNRLTLEAMQRCHDRLVQEQVNLSDYNSLENADDIESLRQALGYTQINLYGVSYGTLLAQHFMRLHPTSLRSVVLDGVVPTETNFVLNAAQTIDQSLTRLFDSCATDAACNAQFPHLEEVFFDVVKRLNEDPERIQIQDTDTGKVYPQAVINGETFQWFIFQLLYAGAIVPLIPHIIYDAKHGDFRTVAAILPLLVFDRSMSIGMYYSVLCAEDADFTADEQNLEGIRPQIVELQEDQPQMLLDTCKIWQVSPLPAAVDDPVAANMPTLLLSGGFDPITPPQYAAAVAQNLPNSLNLVFPAGGHGQLLGGDCSDEIIRAFINDPNTPPDSSCIQAAQKPVFVTNQTIVPLPALYKALQADPATLILLALIFFGWLFLATSVLVFPAAWLFNLLQRPKRPALGSNYPTATDSDGSIIAGTSQSAPFAPGLPPAPRPSFIRRAASWLPVLAALVLGVFMVSVAVVLAQMVSNNNNALFYGLDGSARPWFILPIMFVLITFGMLAAALHQWLYPGVSLWRRLYYSLLSLTALGGSLVLAWLGMLRGLF